MSKIAADYKDKGVEFYNVYTREPHPGKDLSKRIKDERFDFSDKKQTGSFEEREAYALEMIQEFGETRPILIDTIGKECVQTWLGGNAPNSLVVIDREGRLVLWQAWSNPDKLRTKLEEMTKDQSSD